ncbi:hypothetical protein ID866_7962 [Astraeus odoratus]|nr:hypothetical protein ID866_7962 [Astraeus odoratus]
MAIGWCGQLVFDIVIFVLTLWRTLRVRIPGGRNVSDVLLRDGAPLVPFPGGDLDN